MENNSTNLAGGEVLGETKNMGFADFLKEILLFLLFYLPALFINGLRLRLPFVAKEYEIVEVIRGKKFESYELSYYNPSLDDYHPYYSVVPPSFFLHFLWRGEEKFISVNQEVFEANSAPGSKIKIKYIDGVDGLHAKFVRAA